MSKKIAPKLEAWMEECDRHALLWHRPLKKELRALLAVARAANRAFDIRAPHYTIVNNDLASVARVRRALARLSRVSGGKP